MRPGLAIAGFALLVALSACAAPSTQSASAAPAADDGQATHGTPPPTAVAQSAAPQQAPRRIKMPPLGGPLPPERVAIDRSCNTDADCAVKDVGNCCGTSAPSCVNRDAKIDPAAVRAQCGDARGETLCATPLIEGCRCIDGRCEAKPQMVDPVQQAAEDTPP